MSGPNLTTFSKVDVDKMDLDEYPELKEEPPKQQGGPGGMGGSRAGVGAFGGAASPTSDETSNVGSGDGRSGTGTPALVATPAATPTPGPAAPPLASGPRRFDERGDHERGEQPAG